MNRNRRAAFLHAATLSVTLLVLLAVLLAGCDDFTLYEQFPAVDSSDPEPVVITPDSVTLEVEEVVSFTASGGTGGYEFTVVEADGGTIAADGASAEYTAPAAPGEFTVRVTDGAGDTANATVTVTAAPLPLAISPVTREMEVKETALFTASGGAGGYAFSVVEPAAGTVDWSTDTAIYTAPSVPGDYTVRVTDSEGATADAAVHVMPEPLPLVISPTSSDLHVGETETFTASGGVGGYEFVVVETGGGTITATGDTAQYTAPSAPGTFTVRVIDDDGDTADATVSVTYPPLTIDPAVAAVNIGGTLTFAASGGAGGYAYSKTSGPPSATVHPGTGLFNAGNTPGEATIRVTDAAAQFTEASVTIIENQELFIIPSEVTISVDTDYQFSSVGGTGNKTFGMVFGVDRITDDGLYTAPSTATTDYIEVVDEVGNSDEAIVYVVDIGPLEISPDNPEIEEGASISFSGSGGTPPYTIEKVSGPPTFNPATDTYTADSGQVGPDLVTIAITDNVGTTTDTRITVRPSTPSGLVADGTYPGPKTVELTWIDHSSAETGYRIERKTGSGGSYAPIATVAADTEIYLDDDAALSPNTLYVYRVIAEATGIESSPSAEASDLSNAGE